MHVDLTSEFGQRIFRWGFYDPAALAMLDLIRPGDRIVDGGANQGAFTLLAAHAVGPAGQVTSFEPSPETFELLRRNVLINEMSWVEPVNAALADTEGEIEFYSRGVGSPVSSAFSTSPTEEPIAVRTTTLDGIGPHPPNLIKLDLEGGEAHALAGAKRTLQSRATFWIVELDDDHLRRANATVESLIRLFQSEGYDGYAILPGIAAPYQLLPVSTRPPERAHPNVLFVPEGHPLHRP